MKHWAVFPFTALVVCFIPRYRRHVLTVVCAAAGGFVLPSLPFLPSAPRNFLSQVLVEQLLRKANLRDRAGIVTRLKIMTGIGSTLNSPKTIETEIAFVLDALVAMFAYTRRFQHEGVDVYLLVAALFTVGGLLLAPESHAFNGYFSAPFLVGVVSVSLPRLARRSRPPINRPRVSAIDRRAVSWMIATAGGLAVVGLALYVTTYYSSYAWAHGLYQPWLTEVSDSIPVGSCVAYSQVFVGVDTNRLQASSPGCPNVVDPYGR